MNNLDKINQHLVELNEREKIVRHYVERLDERKRVVTMMVFMSLVMVTGLTLFVWWAVR